MRRMQVRVAFVARHEDAAALETVVRAAIGGCVRAFGLRIEVEDLGPVEHTSLVPDGVRQAQAGAE